MKVSEERGVVAIIVAIGLVSLIGIAAYVIDVGALYEERRDLQTGAEAAALAAAADAAVDGCDDTSDAAYIQASTLASRNSNDGAAVVLKSQSDIVCDGNEVTVTARTLDAVDGDGEINFALAPVLGRDGQAVTATASAVWGQPTTLGTLPITFSICEWEDLIGDSPGIVYFHNPNPQGPGNGGGQGGGPGGPIEDCASGPGKDVDGDGDNGPSAFGFLESDGDCEVDLTLLPPGHVHNPLVGDAWAALAPGDSGAAHPGALGCDGSAQDFVGKRLLVPVFADLIDTSYCQHLGANGNDACYVIVGFAAIQIEGMKFQGNGNGAWNAGDTSGCQANQDCIKGHFVELVDLHDGLGEIGAGGADFGVNQVKLSG
jgi:Putative Flp pilus-assembly TadE/G-like